MSTKLIGKLLLTHSEWLILLILFPLVVTITPSRSPFLILILIPFSIRYFKNGAFLPQTPFNLPLLGILLMVLVSLWATYDISLSLRKVANLTWGIVLFWTLHDNLRFNKKTKCLLTAFICVIGVTVSVISLFNPLISLKIPNGNLIFQTISAIPGATKLRNINPNEIGGILTWCIPFSFSLFVAFFQRTLTTVTRENWQELSFLGLLGASFLPMSVVLFYTSSRTAIGSTLIALILITWLMGPRISRKFAFYVLAIATIIILSGLYFADLNNVKLILFDFVENLTGKSSGVGNGVNTLKGRVQIWSRALYGIQDFPFTGMGMNTFRKVVHILYPLFTIASDIDIAHAHNQFLQAALDLGILGLIFFMATWIIAIALLIKCWKSSLQSSWERALIAGLVGSMLASFIFGITDAIALGAIPSFIFWLLLSIISASYSDLYSKQHNIL